MIQSSRLREDLLSAKLLRAVVAGWVLGAVLVLYCFALATLVFNGPLLPYAAQGAGMMMFGGFVFCLLIGATSCYPGMLGMPQEIPATVLGALAGGVVAAAANGPALAAFMTMTALLIVSGTLTGAVFLAIGHFRLSNLFHFIPYPVAGGFFAGTGWVLILASLSTMSGATLDWQGLPGFFEPAAVWKWGPGAAYGIVLALIMKRASSPTIMVASLVLAGALYHLGLFGLDIGLAEARALGLLVVGNPEGGLWPAFGLADLGAVDWGVIAGLLPNLVPVVMVTLLCLLIYVDGLQVATGVEIDMDREFRAAGIAGIFAGAGGSAPGCQTFGLSLASRWLGADTPWTGPITALVVILTLFFGGDLLALIPIPVIGGLLLAIGFDLLGSWLIGVRKKLPLTDYGVVLLICSTIAVFGFVEGVAVGMAATLSLFAMRLSRVDTIAESFTGGERYSSKIRSVPDRALLLDRSEKIRAYRLRGYIFFGSARPLVDRLKQPLADKSPPEFILLDFAEVSGCDFSAINALCEFVRSADTAGARVVFSAASQQIEANLRANLTVEVRNGPRFEPDLDRGLERCEASILAQAEQEHSDTPEAAQARLLTRVADDLERHLDEQASFEDMVERLTPWLEPRDYRTGEALAVPGERQGGLQLLVSGQASVLDANGVRLAQCGRGDAVAPWTAFGEHLPTTAVVADVPCRTMLLTPAARTLLEADDKALSLSLYRFLVDRPPPGSAARQPVLPGL